MGRGVGTPASAWARPSARQHKRGNATAFESQPREASVLVGNRPCEPASERGSELRSSPIAGAGGAACKPTQAAYVGASRAVRRNRVVGWPGGLVRRDRVVANSIVSGRTRQMAKAIGASGARFPREGGRPSDARGDSPRVKSRSFPGCACCARVLDPPHQKRRRGPCDHRRSSTADAAVCAHRRPHRLNARSQFVISTLPWIARIVTSGAAAPPPVPEVVRRWSVGWIIVLF